LKNVIPAEKDNLMDIRRRNSRAEGLGKRI
jgi:hypothetical protein